MLPNFLVVGAMKAGTTSLHRYLATHPQVFMSETKELHFFAAGLTGPHSGQGGWEKGRDWYEEQFARAGEALAVGESSPSYSAFPLRKGVPARIADAIPHARFIYLLRHPLERARSEYVHKRLNGRERRPIDRALLEDSVYLDKSRYAFQMEQYLAIFPPERLLAVLTEDLRDDRDRTMARIWEFLGVDLLSLDEVLQQEFHRNDDKEAISTRRRLARRIPGYAQVARRSPRVVRQIFRAATRLDEDPRQVRIADSVRIEMHRRLAPDLERLRELVPHAVQRWGL